MNIAIRDTVEADLPEIFHIRNDPLVKPHQYKLNRRDTIDLWKRQLFSDCKNDRTLFKCTTIERDSELVGYISQLHWKSHGRRTCYCGWDLAPCHWGQGIAGFAVAELLDCFFRNQNVDAVISDCFSDNRRGIRVLQKLNYEPTWISPNERLRILIAHRCLHWIRRFRMTADRWGLQRG
jgi:RimJ/RimL family protein N-acetyltransferase